MPAQTTAASSSTQTPHTLYERVVGALTEGVVVHNGAGAIVACNTSAERILGLSQSQILGLTSHDPSWHCIHEDGSPLPAEQHPAMLALQRGQPVCGTVMGVYHSSGNLKWIEVNACPLTDDDGNIEYIAVSFSDITARKDMQRQLTESESRYRSLVEISSDGIFINKDGCIRYINNAGLKILGAENSSQVVGRPVFDFFHPNYHSLIAERIRKLLQENKPVPPLEEKIVRLDGSCIDVEVVATPFEVNGKRAIHVLLHDLTERKRSEQITLQASRQLAQATLDAMPTQICVTDEKGIIISVNKAWRNYALDYYSNPAVALEGADYVALCEQTVIDTHPESRDTLTALRQLLSCRIAEFEMEYPCGTEPQRLWYRTRMSRFSDHTSACIVIVHEDMTERHNMTMQLAQSQKLESLGYLAGGIAHDMNNILGAIMSIASSQRDARDEPPSRLANWDTITKACQRGSDVVKSLLYFARKDMDTHANLDMNAIIRELAQLLNATLLKRFIVHTTLDPALPLMKGDGSALHHALMNLCFNAADAMPNGGVIAMATHRTADGGLEIHVQDNGTGMSTDVANRAVDPFFTTKPAGKGTGLGLAMVYGVVTAHRGTLSIHSMPDKGTCIVMTFPATADTIAGVLPSGDAATQATEALTEDNGSAAQTALNILLVDDDELIRDAVGEMIQTLGHNVATASSGNEALALLQEGRQPDLVILDMLMPGLSGLETLQKILQLRPTQAVLLASGYHDKSITELRDSNSQLFFLDKPFGIQKLRDTLAVILPALQHDQP